MVHVFVITQFRMEPLSWTYSYPTSSALHVLPLQAFSSMQPLPFAFESSPTPGIFPPLSFVVPMLHVSETLPPSACSLQASYPALLSLSVLVPAQIVNIVSKQDTDQNVTQGKI